MAITELQCCSSKLNMINNAYDNSASFISTTDIAQNEKAGIKLFNQSEK